MHLSFPYIFRGLGLFCLLVKVQVYLLVLAKDSLLTRGKLIVRILRNLFLNVQIESSEQLPIKLALEGLAQSVQSFELVCVLVNQALYEV